jgi:hypothetical protein
MLYVEHYEVVDLVLRHLWALHDRIHLAEARACLRWREREKLALEPVDWAVGVVLAAVVVVIVIVVAALTVVVVVVPSLPVAAVDGALSGAARQQDDGKASEDARCHRSPSGALAFLRHGVRLSAEKLDLWL